MTAEGRRHHGRRDRGGVHHCKSSLLLTVLVSVLKLGVRPSYDGKAYANGDFHAILSPQLWEHATNKIEKKKLREDIQVRTDGDHEDRR